MTTLPETASRSLRRAFRRLWTSQRMNVWMYHLSRVLPPRGRSLVSLALSTEHLKSSRSPSSCPTETAFSVQSATRTVGNSSSQSADRRPKYFLASTLRGQSMRYRAFSNPTTMICDAELIMALAMTKTSLESCPGFGRDPRSCERVADLLHEVRGRAAPQHVTIRRRSRT